MSALWKRSQSHTFADKYYINFSDPDKTLHNYTILERNFQRTIIKAIQTEIARSPKKVVVKILPHEYAYKALHEYNISEKLRNIKGFMIYICIVQCNGKYIPNKHPSICQENAAFYNGNGQLQLLVMPFIKHGSMRNYSWNANNIILLRSCLKQVVYCILNAYIHAGFLHNDLHLNNVLVMPHYICIMDFEYSLINVDIYSKNNIEQLYNDFIVLFRDLITKEGANLSLKGIKPILKYLHKKESKREHVNVEIITKELSDYIDQLILVFS